MAFIGGDLGSVTVPSNVTMGVNAWSLSVDQSVMEAIIFGQRWPTVRGAVLRGSVTLSGFTLSGSSSCGLSSLIQTSASWTGTCKTGNTVTANIVFTNMTVSTTLEQFVQQTQTARVDGATTETWA